ncbi:hypothetical protein HanIR_Chr11g0549211 [Helianthus annuus]|nr:hypothetical protein HanIR_Chr11g0549211 [Helianthus annuus]
MEMTVVVGVPVTVVVVIVRPLSWWRLSVVDLSNGNLNKRDFVTDLDICICVSNLYLN